MGGPTKTKHRSSVGTDSSRRQSQQQCATRMAAPKKYGRWEEKDLERALQAVREDHYSVRNAAKEFSIPRATLQRHLLGKNKYAVDGKKHFGSPTVLSKEQEANIVQHVLDLEAMLFGISKETVQQLAFELAVRNNAALAHRFNTLNKCAGRKWFRNFMARNPQLSYRTPEGTSIARAAGFNRKSVERFYDILESVLDKYKFDATTIYNMDETSLSTVQKPGKVLARKGKHQVGAITSAERGTSVTCVCCVSASGNYLPPFLIYKRKRMRDELKTGAPPGTGFAVQDKGWMDKETFCLWLEHFIRNIKPSKESPVLLVLDGHISHTGNLRAVELAAEHGVVMLSLPPHCSHRMQPLDLTYFKPLSTYFNQAVDKFMRTHPGRCVQPNDIASLLGEAFGLASGVATAVKGFEKSGIWPPNRNVFSDADFTATSVAAVDKADQHEVQTSRACENITSDEVYPASATDTESEDNQGQTPVSQGLEPSTGSQPDPATSCHAQQMPRSSEVITKGDGRCFFRSIVLCTNKDVQNMPRKDDGAPVSTLHELKEIALADSLRAAVISSMVENANELMASLGPNTTEILNADVPENIHFASLNDRLLHMSSPTASVGELEIVATAKYLNKTIMVVNDAFENSNVYNDVHDRKVDDCVVVAFHKISDSIGHYNAVLTVTDGETADSAAESMIPAMPLTTEDSTPSKAEVIAQDIPLPRKSPTISKRRRRCQQAELITSSPYKRKLIESEKTKTKQAPGRRRLSPNTSTTKAKPRRKLTATTAKPVEEESRFCVICGEDRQEAMTQCISCFRWSHNKCADQTKLVQYVCDLCS